MVERMWDRVLTEQEIPIVHVTGLPEAVSGVRGWSSALGRRGRHKDKTGGEDI